MVHIRSKGVRRPATTLTTLIQRDRQFARVTLSRAQALEIGNFEGAVR